MSVPTLQVLVEFSNFDPTYQPFFELDNTEKGVLDNTTYLLAPADFIDITNRVRAVNIARGKGTRFASFQAAGATVVFNNHDRAFDPLYEFSPFFGNIVPRRRILIRSGGVAVFTGFIEDWDLTYTPDGDSIASAKCYDALYILAGQEISAQTPIEQTTGERIEAILDLPEVDWDATARDIDTGINLVGTQEISDRTNALNYLQKVAETESGLLFVAADGDLTFRDKYKSAGTAVTEFSDAGIGFSGLSVIYGSELLYNEVVIANVGGGTATASDSASQSAYGIRSLGITDLLGANDTQSLDLSLYYANKFSQPQYRFESLDVPAHKLDETEQAEVLGLELGDAVAVKFTPNGIGTEISRNVEIIRIEHDIRPETHFITYGFQEVKGEFFILDDAVFGKLDEGILA